MITIIAGISCSSEKEQNIKMAESAAYDLYEAIKNRQFNTAALMYSDRFYEQISKPQWIRLLTAVQEKYGAYQSRKLVNTAVNFGFSTISGVTTVLVYRVKYEKKTTIEKLTFVRKTPDSKEIELVGHFIDYKVDQ
jgi:hypothetical protein